MKLWFRDYRNKMNGYFGNTPTGVLGFTKLGLYCDIGLVSDIKFVKKKKKGRKQYFCFFVCEIMGDSGRLVRVIQTCELKRVLGTGKE